MWPHTLFMMHYLILQLTKFLWPVCCDLATHPKCAHSLKQITYVDFVFYELLDQHRLFESTLLDDFAKIKVTNHVDYHDQH